MITTTDTNAQPCLCHDAPLSETCFSLPLVLRSLFLMSQYPLSFPQSSTSFPGQSSIFISCLPHPNECLLQFLLKGSISNCFFLRTAYLSIDIINAYEAQFFSIFFSKTLTIPGKVMTTQQAVTIMNTYQVCEFGVGEILSHSLNSYRILRIQMHLIFNSLWFYNWL